jgi:hypothetical protein
MTANNAVHSSTPSLLKNLERTDHEIDFVFPKTSQNIVKVLNLSD